MRHDAALFESFERGLITSTLRIYSWKPKCISLGYAQEVERLIGGKVARRLGWDIVRRPTGGGIVFHNEAEVTYSLVTSLDNPILPKGLIPAYRKISEAVISALKIIGVKAELQTSNIQSQNKSQIQTSKSQLCFSYPTEYEIVVNDKKIVGSAQKRGKRALLQQGSIFVRRTEAKALAVLKKPDRRINAISVEEIIGRVPSFEELAGALVAGFKRILGVSFLGIFLISSVQAATFLDPALKWRTLETKHFSIHYHDGLEETASRLAPLAEEVNQTLSKIMRSRVSLRTQIVLLDNSDYGNGLTTIFPYPWIILYLTDLGGNLNPYKYDDYLRYLFLHEYVHALHLDMSDGIASLFRLIFGRTTILNAISPGFIIEGLATYMETRYTSAGRGRDPRWEMMLRMDVLENNLKSIDQAAVSSVKWPMGHLRYLYGVEFLEYLADKYGETKLVTLTHIYGDHLLASGIDGAFVALYGKTLGLLWDEWLEAAREKYKAEKTKLGVLTQPELITTNGYYNLKPKWSKNGQSIYFISRDLESYPAVKRLNLMTKQTERLVEGLFFDDNFSVSSDGRRLLLSKFDTFKNFYYYKDVYSFDLKKKQLERLTNGGRAADPAISPDGKTLVYVKNEKGMRSLVGVPLSFEAGVQYFSPGFSPDGRQIAAAKHTTDGRQKIYLINVVSGRETILNSSDQTSTEANPVFTPDGNYVLFDSDRTGVVNLYASELASGKLFQLTNVLGGALMPDVSPDGKLIVYVSYSSRGYDLAVMEWMLGKGKDASLEVGSGKLGQTSKLASLPTNPLPTRESYNIHDYNPLPSLVPTFWIPYNYLTENGIQNSIYIGGVDPLGQHTYYLNYGYDFEVKRPSYTLYYSNDQFLPRLAIQLNDLTVPYTLGGQTYWERDREDRLSATIISNRGFKEYDRLAVTFGLKGLALSGISTPESFTPRPATGRANALQLALSYSASRTYGYSISPEDGFDLSAGADLYGGDFTFTNYNLSAGFYQPVLMKHHVLATSVNGFYSRGQQLSQGNFTWKYLKLRGYLPSAFSGNKAWSGSFEYRFPLGYPELGLLYGATFFDRLWGALFFDLGGAGFTSIDLKRALGAEINLATSTLWGAYGFTLKFGYVKGLDAGGEEKTYFNVGL